jgi:amino acid adenylation domain-containing protein
MTETAIPWTWIRGEPCQVPDRAVHELFAAEAQRNPDAVAIEQWDVRLSYRKVAQRAAALARRLRAAGAGPGMRVGVCMRRTPWLPVSELAVLISGGAFVPLDPDQPLRRLQGIARNAALTIALVDSANRDVLSDCVERLINVDLPDDDEATDRPGEGEADAGEYARVSPDDVAYIMHTSGSTGQPKGVMVSHRNLAAMVAAANQNLGHVSGYRLVAFAAMGYDVSIFEFFTPLVCGSSVQIVSEAERADAELLQHFLEAHQTSHACLPPALLPLLDPEHLPGVQVVMVGGEPCDPRQVGRWTAGGRRRFFNWYGPTETTVIVAGAELAGEWDGPLPIGRPLPGASVYILDRDMAVCPPGVPGELFIGGPQVALGYAANPQETERRFVPDPLSAPELPSSRHMLYRTGDLAVWDGTGLISFLGRADRQLKIHGRRVEPGEIEVALSGHPRVTQAVVDVVGSSIRAYVTPLDAPSSDELREYCSARLPRHMVPARVTALARMPLTVNAKTDLVALRQLDVSQESPDAVAQGPGNELENAVAQGWAALFDTGHPRLDDDFFFAGGDSLSAMRLASELRRVTGRNLSVEDIFEGRTVSGIAARLGRAAITVSTLPSGSAAALSPTQRRLWFVEQFAPDVPLHNVFLCERIIGPLDVAALGRAFAHVAKRQGALRWRLVRGDGTPAVIVADPAPVVIPVDDLSAIASEVRQEAVDRLLDEEVRTPISLTEGPMWRVRLIRLGDEEHVLVMNMHHLIFDGWSQSVLYRELSQAYKRFLAGEPADDPAPDQVTFADYTAWTIDQAQHVSAADVTWWQDHLAGAPTVLDLPSDRPRRAVLSFTAAIRRRAVDPELANGVTRLAAAEATTVWAVLIAAFGELLRRLTGQSDLVVGTPVSDRGRAEFEDVIGCLIRTLPLRLKVDDRIPFIDLVRRCGSELEQARQHADVPLERIVEIAGDDRDLTRNPLFQVMFNIYNFPAARLDLGSPVVLPQLAGVPGSSVDLTVYVIFRDGGMHLEAAYNPDLYDAGRIDALLASYAYLLHELSHDPRQITAAVSARPADSPLPDQNAPLCGAIPVGPGLLEQFRAIASAHPDSVAIEEPGGSLTYGDILRTSDGIAAALRATHAGPGGVVAVLANRSAILAPVLLGVLSGGTRWAILDSEVPAAVLHRRLAALEPSAVIRCAGELPRSAVSSSLPVIEAAAQHLAPEHGTDIPAAERGYLSLTSGSTGEPKVVRTGEAPLVHFLDWYRATLGFTPRDRFALLGGVGHDPVLREMFTPLVCGARLLVPSGDVVMDPSRLLDWLAEHEITVVHLTPQLLRMMTAGPYRGRAVEGLRLVALAGDQLTERDAARLRLLAPNARLLNCYGATETPQVQACHEILVGEPVPDEQAWPGQNARPIPIGRGIDGAQLLVTTASGQPAAVGELGEVFIRSHHLSDGYTDPALTRERYLSLPGVSEPGVSEGRVFRTGDGGRYDANGAVILAGRLDDQVKVRGFRVELGEVETVLLSHPDVQRAAVRPVELGGATALYAYVTTTGPAVAETHVLDHARRLLPPEAVPSGVAVLSALPLTANGKTDRSRLPEPQWQSRFTAQINGTPASELERLVLAVWREVLGVPEMRVGSNQKFFEIGGHSMALVEVQWRLARALGRPIPIVDLFRFPTIRSLADHLSSGEQASRAAMRGLARRQRLVGQALLGARGGDGQ